MDSRFGGGAGGFSGGGGGFNDIFGDVFGGRGSSRRSARGQDLQYNLDLSLKEARIERMKRGRLC